MGNQQIENLYETINKLRGVPGWELREDEGFLALKAPVAEPLLNYVWAAATAPHITLAKAFYEDQAFTWVLDQPGDATLRAAGFQDAESAPDMAFELEDYAFPGYGPGITVIRTYSTADFHFWASTAGEALGLDVDLLKAFFLPLVREAGYVPFLAFHDGRPAATAMLFPATRTAGIYAVGTREPFRRLGLGHAVIHACLQLARDRGMARVVLSSSAMGLHLYQKLGFHTERTVWEYLYRPAPLGPDSDLAADDRSQWPGGGTPRHLSGARHPGDLPCAPHGFGQPGRGGSG